MSGRQNERSRFIKIKWIIFLLLFTIFSTDFWSFHFILWQVDGSKNVFDMITLI